MLKAGIDGCLLAMRSSNDSVTWLVLELEISRPSDSNSAFPRTVLLRCPRWQFQSPQLEPRALRMTLVVRCLLKTTPTMKILRLAPQLVPKDRSYHQISSKYQRMTVIIVDEQVLHTVPRRICPNSQKSPSRVERKALLSLISSFEPSSALNPGRPAWYPIFTWLVAKMAASGWSRINCSWWQPKHERDRMNNERSQLPINPLQ